MESNAKLQKRVTDLEDENIQFKETFINLMKSVQDLTAKNETYENRLQDFEEICQLSGEISEEQKSKYPSYQDLTVTEVDSLTSTIVI